MCLLDREKKIESKLNLLNKLMLIRKVLVYQSITLLKRTKKHKLRKGLIAKILCHYLHSDLFKKYSYKLNF